MARPQVLRILPQGCECLLCALQISCLQSLTDCGKILSQLRVPERPGIRSVLLGSALGQLSQSGIGLLCTRQIPRLECLA